MEKVAERLVDIKQDENGAIDFKAIKAEKISNYWEDVFKKNVATQKKLKSTNKAEIKGNERALVESFNEYFTTGEMARNLTKYLFAGNPNLNLDATDGDGIATIMARSLMKFKSIYALYYYHVRNVPAGNFSKTFNRLNVKIEFASNVVENALCLVKDMWDFETLIEFAPKADAFFAIAHCIESNLFYYEKLLKPVRQVRVLDLIKNEDSLPSLAEIKKRYHVISALSIASFEDLKKMYSKKFPPEIKVNKKKKTKSYKNNTKLINALIDDISKTWQLHKSALNIRHEADTGIFDSEMNDLIDSLTTGVLRESEKLKNANSGEDKRLDKKLKARFDKDPDFIKKVARKDEEALRLLGEEDLATYADKEEALQLLIELAAFYEKEPEALSRLKEADPVKISIDHFDGDDNADAYDNKEKLNLEISNLEAQKDIESPDDNSVEIWENLSIAHKLYLMCMSKAIVLKQGFDIVFDKYTEGATKVLDLKYILLDVNRIVLEKLTGVKLEAINAKNHKKISMKINEIAESKKCKNDLYANYAFLKNMAAEILNGGECASLEKSLADKAYAIFDELTEE